MVDADTSSCSTRVAAGSPRRRSRATSKFVVDGEDDEEEEDANGEEDASQEDEDDEDDDEDEDDKDKQGNDKDEDDSDDNDGDGDGAAMHLKIINFMDWNGFKKKSYPLKLAERSPFGH